LKKALHAKLHAASNFFFKLLCAGQPHHTATSYGDARARMRT